MAAEEDSQLPTESDPVQQRAAAPQGLGNYANLADLINRRKGVRRTEQPDDNRQLKDSVGDHQPNSDPNSPGSENF